MIIKWNINPRYTICELTQTEKDMINKLHDQEEILETACVALHYVKKNDASFERHMKSFFKQYDKLNDQNNANCTYIYALEKYPHDGDCMCFPATCIKCQAEELINFSSIKGISKYSLRHIDSALIQYNNNHLNAIKFLKEEYKDSIDTNINDTLKNKWINDAKIAAQEYEKYLIKSNLY